MIQQTFLFLDGISQKTEDYLKKNSIRTWDDFLTAEKVVGFSIARKRYYDRKIKEAKRALFQEEASYFCGVLPASEHWRLYQHFKEEAVYLDIETDGLGRFCDATVIGLSDGHESKTMIKGINLDIRALRQELAKYKLLVTFNGSVFDVPFLEKRYPAIVPSIPHFDLRFSCDRLGWKGGLKEVERTLGIRRNKIVEELHGGDALTLWKMYKATGDEHYLNLLVEYNEEDVLNLKRIAEKAYEGLSAVLGSKR